MPSIVFTARNIFFASFIATFMLTLFNYALIDNGILSYRTDALGGNSFQGLPIAAPLMKFLMFISALYLYVFLNNKYGTPAFEKYTFGVSNILLGLCIAVGFFVYARPYTFLTFVLLFLMLIAIEYINKIRFMGKFYRVYLAFLIPFWLISFILIKEEVFTFNPAARIQYDFGPVPIENMFVWMIMLLIAVFVFERLQVGKKKA